MKRKKIRRNSSRNDLIDGAVDVIINTRDFVGNEKQAIRDYCFENEILDCKGFYKIAMAKANLKWNAYRRDARGLRRNAGSKTNCDIITSTDWEDKENTLVYEKNLSPVCVGQKVRNRDSYIVSGGRAPHKPSSSGRVYVKTVGGDRMGREFFPNVFKMKWIPSYNLYPMDKVSGKARLKINRNAGRKRTWKIGEYAVGGIIEAKVNQTVTAVGIRNAEYKNNATIATRLFRWPLDEFRLEEYLNDLTTSYYASQIIDWIKGQKQNIIRGNPEGSPQVDSSPLKKLVMDLASDFAPVVKDIESSRYSTTQNNYGRYMSLISSMSKGDKKRAEIIAMALITAGANRSGVKSALRVMFGE